MSEVPDAVDPLLLTGLRRSLERLGWEVFVSGPLLVHDRVCFPDEWSDDLAGVQRAFRRALMHAGHPGLSVRIVDPGPAKSRRLELVAIADDALALRVIQLAAPKLLLHEVALEVARASLLLTEAPLGPYDDGGVREGLPKDKAATLAEFALGFGVIALDGCAEPANADADQPHRKVGGLQPEAAASLLAVQLVVRGREELAAATRGLPGPEGQAVADAVASLKPHRDALVEALGLPAPDGWPKPRPVEESMLPPDPVGEASVEEPASADAPPPERADKETETPASDEVAFESRQTHEFRGGVLGLIAGGLAAGLLGSVIPLVAGAAAGVLLGRAVLVSRTCSACRAPLAADAVRCDACGAALVHGEDPPESDAPA